MFLNIRISEPKIFDFWKTYTKIVIIKSIIRNKIIFFMYILITLI